jgi:uncharacterized protein (DUF2062 family)
MVRRKFRKLVKDIFAQGVSPKKLALSLSLGVFVGTVPVLWGATIVCAALAFKFRLNHPGIQAANYLFYPIQIAMVVPFYRIGARIFPWGPPVSVDIILNELRKDWLGNLALILVATLKAIAVWLLVAAPLCVVLYFLLVSLFSRMPRFKDLSDSGGR